MREQSSATYRGFLFADLRDYTSFVERHGDAAASELLDRYRALMRSTVAEYGGAEVKTEGDSFFVVFSSATSGVRCALEIVQAAAAATRKNPTTPLRVGIGVHAGETVAGTEGYVGAAVNLAARVCARARAGEVVVTDTVRSLTRTSLQVEFTDRGRRRLKGIAEPVQLYLVLPGRAEGPVASRIFLNWAQRRYSVALLAAVVIVLAGVGAAWWLTGRPPQAPPEAPRPLNVGELQAGTYATIEFQPPFTFSVGPGWHVSPGAPDKPDAPDDLFMSRTASPRGGLGAFRTNVVYSGPCETSPTQRIEGGSDALLTWLEQHPHLASVNPRPRIVDGITGIQIDVTGRTPEEPCPDGNVYLMPLGRGGIWVSPSDTVRFIVLDVPGGTVTFDISAPTTTFNEFLVEADAVIDSVEFVDVGG